MSEKIVSVRKKGSSEIHAELLKSFTIATTTATTITLDVSLAGYRYVMFRMAVLSRDDVWPCNGQNTNAMAFLPVEYFKTNPMTLYYCTGSSGSAGFQNNALTYVSDTSISSKQSSSTSRTYYVYGIK